MSLFDRKTAYSPEDNRDYGMRGDLKKTQYVLQLLGAPWDPNTLKCIITAAEQGMEMVCGTINTRMGEQHSQAYHEVCEFELLPGLKENDFVIAGTDAIMAFIDKRGLGHSLAPRKIHDVAIQSFWIDVACCEVDARIRTLIKECVLSSRCDEEIVAHTLKELTVVLDGIEKQLEHNTFIAGKQFGWADIHWLAYMYLLAVTEGRVLVEERQNLQRWLSLLSTRKSNCGQEIIAYQLLPSIEEIQQGILPAVRITDF